MGLLESPIYDSRFTIDQFYEKQQFVSVEGQVIFPGVYALERKDERISDLMKRVVNFR